MKSNPARLVLELQESGINRGPILDAIRYVPRSLFLPREQRIHAWDNRPLPIGAGQSISQPYTVARMLELAGVSASGRVLEIGCGCGWAAALMAYVVGDFGSVTAVEIIPSLASQAAATLRDLGLSRIQVIQGDGRHGYPPRAPYDSIIVSAQAGSIPENLPGQLAPGGCLVMPVGDQGHTSVMTRVERRGETFETTHHGPYAFVPLV